MEYDLDNEDEDWLRTYNLGRNKLHDLLFEKMLWKLELACAEATDNALTAAGEEPIGRAGGRRTGRQAGGRQAGGAEGSRQAGRQCIVQRATGRHSLWRLGDRASIPETSCRGATVQWLTVVEGCCYHSSKCGVSDGVVELCPCRLAGVLTSAGAGPSERTAASAVAAIDHLPKQEALRILAMECGGR